MPHLTPRAEVRHHTIAFVIENDKKPAPAPRRPPTAHKVRPYPSRSPANPRLFATPEAKRVKKEICAVGRKLWLRGFVDGNGGNISYRVGPNEVICTPTMLSKFDLRPRDLCMVDLDGRQIAGSRQATSEILLHLEIYKKVPQARAAVHCHPPHATAYAITGLAPPNRILPEYDIFVSRAAVAPYETPGTTAFARTVLPFVKEHNVVLLGNHGVVTWADTPTLAEWHCEVLETYCAILAHARQLGAPIRTISADKCKDLAARRKRAGFPQQRPAREAAKNGKQTGKAGRPLSSSGIEGLVQRVTRAVLKEMGVS